MKMTNGWVKIFRSLKDWEWFTDSHMVHFFIYLVVSANVEDSMWRGMPVKRGQLVTGLRSLSEATGMSIRSIRTCIDRMVKTGEILISATSAYSVITVCKYDDYQQSEALSDKPTTSKRQRNDKQTTTKEEEEEEKEERGDARILFAYDVRMTQKEYDKLVVRYGKDATDWMIEKLSLFKGSKGTKYKSDYMAILSWVVDKYAKEYKPKTPKFVP